MYICSRMFALVPLVKFLLLAEVTEAALANRKKKGRILGLLLSLGSPG